MTCHYAVLLCCATILFPIWACAPSDGHFAAAEPARASAQQTSPSSSSDPATRIQSKIGRIGDRATKINSSGGDVSWIQKDMQQVDSLLKGGDHVAAERILDSILRKLGEPVESSSTQATSAQATTSQTTPSESSDPATRIQSKIGRVGAQATKINSSGKDVSWIQREMQEVDRLLKAGDHVAAERILDALLSKLGEPVTDSGTRSIAAPRAIGQCDPLKPMVVTVSTTIIDDCTIGGDLTVMGKAALYFDYRQRSNGRVVVNGNVLVQEDASLQVDGRPGGRAVLLIDNAFRDQRSMTSRDRAKIKLNSVEFRTQKSATTQGSVSMPYNALGSSSLEVTGSMIVEAQSWLLANLHDSARLTVVDTQHVPNEIYVHDSSVATIRGSSTRTGVWLDAQGAQGTVTVPNVTGPFSWRIGAGNGLNVGWLLQVDNAQPGLGIEIKPGTALTVNGNGSQAPATGELKISYFVNSRETLDGLKAGVQNRVVSNRLTLKNVQLGPIAWQIYAGDNADLSITNSVINEIGIFGRNARVLVERSVLQLAVLAALAPGSSLTINASDIWNQAIEVANQAQISIADSQIHGGMFHARHADSRISIRGGAFRDNPSSCLQGSMVDIATGMPKCNPFSAPGPPRKSGAGIVACSATQLCGF